MIFLGSFKAGASVFYVANFHSDQGTVEDPTGPEAQRRAPDGTWTTLTAPAKQNSKTGHYGGSIDTTGFAVGQHVVRMAGTVTTAKVTATEFSFEIVAYDPADAAALGLSRLDAAVSSRLATGGYTAPDNAGIAATQSAVGALSIPTASQIATAVWGALTSALTTVGSIGKLIVDYLDVAVSSRFAGGVPAEQIQAIAEGGTVIRHRGDHWDFTIEGLESMTGNTKLWLTVKASKSHADAQSAFQIIKGTGLTVLNGGGLVSPVVVGDGSVTDTDSTTISGTLKARANKDLADTTFYYDVQILDVDGNPKTVGQGKWVITADVTRATS